LELGGKIFSGFFSKILNDPVSPKVAYPASVFKILRKNPASAKYLFERNAFWELLGQIDAFPRLLPLRKAGTENIWNWEGNFFLAFFQNFE